MAVVSMVWVLAVGTLQSCANSDDAALEGSYNSEGGYAIYWQMDCRQPDDCQEHGVGMRRLFSGE